MKNWQEKIDNNDTSAGFVTAEDFNSAFIELENTVSPFMALDIAETDQLVKSVDIISKATHYTDSGTANTIVLSRGATATAIETLFDGMVISFNPKYANTGATTININGLGAVPLKLDGADLQVGFLNPSYKFEAIYDLANLRFNILKPNSYGVTVTGILSDGFVKPNSNIALFVKVSASSIKVPIGTKIAVGGNIVILTADYTLSLNTNLDTGAKVAGTDYYVYAKSDSTFYLSANGAITADRLIGGFHYGLTGESEAVSGNKLEADMVKIRGINEYSFWDLKFKPSCNPKGMVHVHGKWYDIYLCNSEHITNGTSKAGATIAGGALTNGRLYPKIPLEYGGNGTLTYGSFKWFHACEIAQSHGKQLICYQEFPTIAYGVQENIDASTVDGGGALIAHYGFLTSKYGIEQATGTQWVWGNDLIGDTAGTFTWQNVTESRGQILSIGNSPNAVILGGSRGDGVDAGSRASGWVYYVWYTVWHVGSRFACDHLQLV